MTASKPRTLNVLALRRKRLISHLKRSNVWGAHFSEKSGCFKFVNANGKLYTASGLVPSLKKVFWPNYKYEKLKRKTRRQGERDKYGGLARGTIMHEQLRLWANEASRGEIRSQYLTMHKYTRKAIGFMEENELTPVRAEVVAFDPCSRVATAIDMVCMNKQGHVILIEWKSGMDSYFDRGNSSMHGPHVVSNCPRNQAFMQLLFGKMMLEQHHAVRSDADYVVQVHKDGVDPFPLPDAMLKKQRQLYEHFFMCHTMK